METGREDFFEGAMRMMRAHFGSAARAVWVCDDELCSCCGKRKIDLMMYQGQEALSINAYMHRERGVMIGYLLCGECALDVMTESEGGAGKLHQAIEKNLERAYARFLNSHSA